MTRRDFLIGTALLSTGTDLIGGLPYPLFTFQDALTASLRTKRPLLFVVASTKCRHCHAQLQGMLEAEIADVIRKKFVVSVWFIDQQGPLPAKIPFEGITPATYIFYGTQLAYGPFSGEIPPQSMLPFLQQF